MNDRKSAPIRLLFGLPADRSQDEAMLTAFLEGEGERIICGGSTATRVAKHLGKPLRVELFSEDPRVPPIAHIEGITLVTEGILTMQMVLSHIKDAPLTPWQGKADGASRIAKLLAESESEIFIYVGLAECPEKNALGLYAAEKVELISAISEILIHRGKTVKTVLYP